LFSSKKLALATMLVISSVAVPVFMVTV